MPITQFPGATGTGGGVDPVFVGPHKEVCA